MHYCFIHNLCLDITMKLLIIKKYKIMKKILYYFLTCTFIIGISCNNSSQKKLNNKSKPKEKQTKVVEIISQNELTPTEKEEGWKLLFDGETTNSWRGYNKDHFPKNWEVIDGTLHCKGSGRGEAGAKKGGDIIYNKKFSNFHLKIDWKISEGGNSGIFYLAKEVQDWVIWKTGLEFQVLDNDKHPGAMLGKDGNRKAGSLYDLIPADPQNTKPAGEWNLAEVLVYKGSVIHKQNGEIIVKYNLWTDDWNELVENSKNPNWANVPKSGYIGLQDHGDSVWFKNIKIKEL
jgi:hypothetical protein